MAQVTLHDLAVSSGQTRILDGIDVDVPDGSFVAVLGPSGVGKSTLLRAIAGLADVDRGVVRFDGADVTHLDAAARNLGMIFQTPALLPKRNVRRNVEFPLELRRETAAVIRNRVNAEVRSLHIEHLLSRRPDQLSRGEEQLVHIARTMVRSPRLLLLDEPFAPLDEHLRHRMRSEIRLLQQGYGVTTIMATNDPVDAASLASMVVVVNGQPARVTQVGNFAEVYEHPVDLDAAFATGSLWTSDTQVESDGRGFWLVRDGAVRLRAWAPTLDRHVGETVVLGVRTDGLIRDSRGSARAVLDRIVPGPGSQLVCRWADHLVHAVGNADASEVGTEISLRIDRPLMFDRDDGRRIA